MKRKKYLPSFAAAIIILLIFLLPGCEKMETGVPIECKAGIKYRINSGLSFTIDSLRDYRCPTDMECLWSGDVDLFFKIHKRFSNLNAMMHLLQGDKNPLKIEDYSLKILEVNPWHKSTDIVEQKDYTIKIMLDKN